jgi:hypothetical protein
MANPASSSAFSFSGPVVVPKPVKPAYYGGSTYSSSSSYQGFRYTFTWAPVADTQNSATSTSTQNPANFSTVSSVSSGSSVASSTSSNPHGTGAVSPRLSLSPLMAAYPPAPQIQQVFFPLPPITDQT